MAVVVDDITARLFVTLGRLGVERIVLICIPIVIRVRVVVVPFHACRSRKTKVLIKRDPTVDVLIQEAPVAQIAQQMVKLVLSSSYDVEYLWGRFGEMLAYEPNRMRWQS